MTFRRTTLSAVVLAVLSIPAAAQYEETLDVRVVQVPVLVYRGAEAVRGLSRDDFELFVNGTRQPIAYFDVLEFGHDAAAPPQPDPPREQRRLTMIVFDASPMERLRVRPAIETLIEKASPADYFAIGIFHGREIRYLTNFTRDRATLLRALAVQPVAPPDPFGIAFPSHDQAGTAASQTAGSNTFGGFSDELFTEIEDFERATASARYDRGGVRSAEDGMRRHQQWLEQIASESWAAALTAIADDLVPLEGIKQVVLLSAAPSMEEPRNNAIQTLHKSFKRAGATLHVIDLNGLRAPGDASSRGSIANYHTPGTLFRAALGTGGRVIATGPAVAVRVLSSSSRTTYLLGFHPPADERDAWNDIDVKVKNQPLFTSVSYRKGYAAHLASTRSLGNVFLADVMQNDIPVSDITVTLRAGGDGIVEVGVPSEELLAFAVDGRMTVDFYLYVFDSAGRAASWKHRRMRIDEAAARSSLRGAELVRREHFSSLPPGRYTAKALVHIIDKGMLGFRRGDFEVRIPR